MRISSVLAASAFLLGGIFPAVAEQMRPLAVNGDWVAMAHVDTLIDPPDVCLAMEPNANFFIRATKTSTEFRFANYSWSLPADVTGTLELDVNGNKYPLDVTGNTNTMVSASVKKTEFLKIIGDMNKASAMSVTAGNSAPVRVPLDGSNTVMSAFLTCSNIRDPRRVGGTNPFQSVVASGN